MRFTPPFIVATLICLAPWCACVTMDQTAGRRPAAIVKLEVQPSSTPVSAAIAPAVAVQVLDVGGRGVAGVEVTMSIGSNAAANGGSAVLGGTLTRLTDSTGIASFPDLTLDWLGTGYTLVAAASAPSGMISATSVPFDETRVGDACLGPAPACSSGCADTDGDGLNDAWEIAGGVDLNGDGKIDAQHDLLLPGADPTKPDVFLKYDYMVATTTSPIGTPPHSHQPPDAAIQQVVDAFASHGVTLHIDPQHDAIPEVPVTTLDPNATVACAGPSFVTVETLRQQHFGNRKWAYHYAVFAHNATLPDTAPDGSSCPEDPECGGHPDPTSTGVSELPGGSFIVAFGYSVDLGFSVGIETQAGTFMHELGHNFGLKHGSLAAPAPQSCDVLKPNYVSVMGYSYQSGIEVAAEPGSSVPMRCQVDGDCPAGTHCTDDFGPGDGGNVCYRSDYSREKLLDLDEAMLNEPLGVAGPAGDTDIIVYCAHGVGCSLMGPGNGPIDWNNDGNATEPDVQGDIDNNGSPNNLLETGNDWELTAGALENLNFKFQCTTAFKADSGESSHASVPSSFATVERSLKDAREKHTLHPDFAAEIAISPSCSQARKPIAPGQPGTLTVALLGSENLDVNQVDTASLTFHGARVLNTSIQDVNHDGVPDLVGVFDTRDVRLHPSADRGTLHGWLKNSRAFFGSGQIRVVHSMALEDPGCR